MTTFPCRSDDFCMEHGYDHMRSRLGEPICFCQMCELAAMVDDAWERMKISVSANIRASAVTSKEG
jgi:hypothetical protein